MSWHQALCTATCHHLTRNKEEHHDCIEAVRYREHAIKVDAWTMQFNQLQEYDVTSFKWLYVDMKPRTLVTRKVQQCKA